MCGIIGINSKNFNVTNSLLDGLKKLEYRGYDSSGMSLLRNGEIVTVKTSGKISALQEILPLNIDSNIGIAHTRWATHGAANNINAHPHQTSQVSVVHNGIIENFISIKQELQNLGHKFLSNTDSEVIPHLITYYLNKGLDPLSGVLQIISRLEGAFSIAAIFPQSPDIMIIARKGSPLVIGCGLDQMLVASDAYALASITNKIIYLEEGDVAVLSNSDAKIYNNAQLVQRNITQLDNQIYNSGKDEFDHYMLKEIFEQPKVLSRVIDSYYCDDNLKFEYIKINFSLITKITLVACGTSYLAAMLSKYWLETMLVDVAIEVDIASEFRYRNSYLPENGLCIFLSQSGETADTLAALRYAKSKKQTTLTIVNVKESSLDRESDYCLECFAGPEISVASTKGFTSQLMILLLLSAHIAYVRTGNKYRLNNIMSLPNKVDNFLKTSNYIKDIANYVASFNNAIFIGRNYFYPVALEGALKLKELSYIHAEAIAAGELKHGPIALVDANIPVIILAPDNHLFEKIYSNAQEVASRSDNIITISSNRGNQLLKSLSKHQINIDSADPLIEPILYALPMQILAYYVAVARGTDVDQPRNLAKSVTVE
jgi:glutamine---fructose-6-phosphate transaminase (isomerizing)